MSLTKEHRDAMPDDDFAVPTKRMLPIHDAVHVRMAHSMLDKTKGLTPAEKNDAESRILHRAKELGVDTSDWDLEAVGDVDQPAQILQFAALAMEFPEKVSDHPNQMPFKGVLTRLDEPSDLPLHGSNGKCVILPKDVAEKALSSLLCMAVDFTPNFDGHDAKQKIGLITEAQIIGNEIQIAGFFYSADFPNEVKRIQAEKAQMGFSYEAQAQLRSLNDDPLVISKCTFTGAAVLYKQKAAYQTTSLSAKSEKTPMTDANNDKVLELIEGLSNKITSMEKEQKEFMASQKKMEAGSVLHMVKPHADALRACANAMSAAGIGQDAKRGHVNVLNHMADSMEADAGAGKIPHIYQTYDFMHASADKSAKAEPSAELKELKAGLADLTTMVTDLTKQKFEASQAPERQTLSPAVAALLRKVNLNASGEDKLSMEEVDSKLSTLNLPPENRIATKRALERAGKL